MDNKSFEELKKKYEDEIGRLNAIAEATQKIYQEQYENLKVQEKALLDEFNTKMQNITIGIERLRGAYTALSDMEEGKDPTLVVNGMMKEESTSNNTNNVVENVDSDVIENTEKDVTKDVKINEDTKKKAKELVTKAKKKELVTSYDDFAKTELGKETAVKDVDSEVSKENLAKLHQSGEYVLSDEESEALKKVIEESKTLNNIEENTPKENTSNVQPTQNINPEEVPDYLKEQYGMK